MQARRKVIFLCTGNSARSQMAEALLRKYAGGLFDVYSAGFENKPIHPMTFEVMQAVDIYLTGHTSKSVRGFLGKDHFSYAITVCDQAQDKCPRLFLDAFTHLYWPFEDPAAFDGDEADQRAKFGEVRDQIDAKIRAWVEEIIAEPSLLASN